MTTHPSTPTPLATALRLLLIFTLSGAATAADLNETTNNLCKKIKSCASAQLEQQDLPPAMLQMMAAMLDETCTNMIDPYANKAVNAGLEKKAISCIKSIETLSCNTLMQEGGAETKACKTLEKAANEAGIDTDIAVKNLR